MSKNPPMLDKYPLDEWEIQWSASYGGNIWGCVLVHPKVAGCLLGDIRNYLNRPEIKENIINYGATYGPKWTEGKREILMTADAMAPVRKLIGLENNDTETELVQAHIASDIALRFKTKCKASGLTQRLVIESLLSDWIDNN